MKPILFVILVLISISCYTQDKIERAYELFDKANSRLKILPEEIDSADIQQSIKEYTEAIELYPEFAQAYRNRARWYNRTNQSRKAVEDLTIAIKYADRNEGVSLYYMRAEAYYNLQQYDSAIKDWTVYIEGIENSVHALINRAKAYYKLGKTDSACEDYKKAIQQNSNYKPEEEFKFCEKRMQVSNSNNYIYLLIILAVVFIWLLLKCVRLHLHNQKLF
jgi:tetratricopeptide (TPR) repeat protein